jgi:dUTP pyrophosphatase
MNNCDVKVKKLEHFDESFLLPQYQTQLAAGADVRLCLEKNLRNKPVVIQPWERVALPTALALEIPAGFEIQVRPRSGLSLKTGLMLLNSPGTIDADYRGELKILMINNSPNVVEINHGDRIAQLVLSPVWIANFISTDQNLSWTERGEKGFGSTGIN